MRSGVQTANATNRFISDYVCICRNVAFSGIGHIRHDASIFISSCGNIFITVRIDNVEPHCASPLSALIADELCQMSAAGLNALAENYTYNTVGQSYRIIDLMMAHGLLHGSDETNLLHSIDAHLHSESVCVAVC